MTCRSGCENGAAYDAMILIIGKITRMGLKVKIIQRLSRSALFLADLQVTSCQLSVFNLPPTGLHLIDKNIFMYILVILNQSLFWTSENQLKIRFELFKSGVI